MSFKFVSISRPGTPPLPERYHQQQMESVQDRYPILRAQNGKSFENVCFFKDFHASEYRNDIEILSSISDKDSYPVILYPETLLKQIGKSFEPYTRDGKSEDKIYYQDFLEAARQLDIKENDWIYPQPAKPFPTEPKEPRMRKYPTEKTEHYSEVLLKNLYFNVFYILIYFVAVILLIVCDEFPWYESIFGYLFSLAIPFGLLYFILSIFINFYDEYPINHITAKKFIKVKLPQHEIEKSREEAERQYRNDMEEYEALMEEYRKRTLEYEEEKERVEQRRKEQAELLNRYEGRIVSRIFEKCMELYNKPEIEESKYPPQRGANEDIFFLALMKKLSSLVKIDRTFRGYFPDIMIDLGYRCPVDIEIDEPYEYKTRKEIHYIGCGDEERNWVFVSNNWFVLRFSENQIKNHISECVMITEALFRFIMNGNVSELSDIRTIIERIREPRWTKEKARMMSLENSRQSNYTKSDTEDMRQNESFSSERIVRPASDPIYNTNKIHQFTFKRIEKKPLTASDTIYDNNGRQKEEFSFKRIAIDQYVFEENDNLTLYMHEYLHHIEITENVLPNGNTINKVFGVATNGTRLKLHLYTVPTKYGRLRFGTQIINKEIIKTLKFGFLKKNDVLVTELQNGI